MAFCLLRNFFHSGVSGRVKPLMRISRESREEEQSRNGQKGSVNDGRVGGWQHIEGAMRGRWGRREGEGKGEGYLDRGRLFVFGMSWTFVLRSMKALPCTM